LDHADNAHNVLEELKPKIIIEHMFVSLSNAVADPWTVVVMSCDTLVTLLTVLGPNWNFKVADCAVLKINAR
jgi:phosphoribosylformylglycinamidine (FGAM) synthase-like enzyme